MAGSDRCTKCGITRRDCKRLKKKTGKACCSDDVEVFRHRRTGQLKVKTVSRGCRHKSDEKWERARSRELRNFRRNSNATSAEAEANSDQDQSMEPPDSSAMSAQPRSTKNDSMEVSDG